MISARSKTSIEEELVEPMMKLGAEIVDRQF